MRRRSASMKNAERPLWKHLADDIAERLALVTRNFENILLIGPAHAELATIFLGQSVRLVSLALDADDSSREDLIDLDDASFDLVICIGTLDSLNDLPGGLIKLRRLLRPDGLFLSCMFAAGTLAAIKRAMQFADGGRATPHVHPQVDLRSAADLLARAGFALPVADIDTVQIAYGDWRTLLSDIRAHGLGNAMAGPRHFLGKDYAARLDAAWDSMRNGMGKVPETIAWVNFSGWAPSIGQPQAAKRGSGAISLATLLDKSGT